MTEIKEMSIEEVEMRTSEIKTEVESGADETRMAELKTGVQQKIIMISKSIIRIPRTYCFR